MTGFSSATFAFLEDLAAGRDRAWFETNRDRYQAQLLVPMRNLVSTIGPCLRRHIPDLECRPQVNKTLTRINRDRRFARGQSPYKDHILALFYRQGYKKLLGLYRRGGGRPRASGPPVESLFGGSVRCVLFCP